MTIRRVRSSAVSASIVRLVPIESLHKDPTNPRQADAARMGLLRLSIAKLGFIQPIFANGDGMILSGHQRLTVAEYFGYKKVPVCYVDIPNDATAGMNLAFNRRLEVHEPVATPAGWREIGTLIPGDMVYGPDGEAHTVTRVSDVQKRMMYTVKLDDGTEILADGEHLWGIERTNVGNTTYLHRETVDTLRMSELLARRVRVCLPRIAGVRGEDKNLPLNPWLLGLLLGDGSLSQYGVRVHSSADEDWVYSRLLQEVPEGTEVHAVRVNDGKIPTFDLVGGGRGGVHYNPALEAARALGIAGTKAGTKFIPDVYLWASYEQRLALLRGLMDSDGCVTESTPIYTTTSLALAEGMTHLVFSLGGKAGMRTMRGAQGTWSAAYQVTVRLPDGLCPVTRPDRVALFRGASPMLRRRVVSVTEAYEADAVCIAIDSEDHLYLTRGFAPTHNSTNDFTAFDTGSKAVGRLDMEQLLELMDSFPNYDIGEYGEKWLANSCKEQDIQALFASPQIAEQYDKKAANIAGIVAGRGIRIPLIVTQSGKILNGVHRGFAALEAGVHRWPVITVPEAHGEASTLMLNYLSMDFHVDDDFKKLLRHSAYRRPQNNRGIVPKSYRFWANGERTLLDKDSYSTEYWTKFRGLHGHTLLDFGSGLSKVAPYLRTKGFDAHDFEPFLIDPDSDSKVPSPRYSKSRARAFLNAISSKELRFDSIFLSSVLNSVPFPEDRLMVLAIVHALCSRKTVVYGTCRDISDYNYEYKGIRNANYFTFDSEPGVRLGDFERNPKLQWFTSQETTKLILSRFWKTVETWPGGNIHYWRASNPMGVNPTPLARALEFEFDLPYKDGTTMGLADVAKDAFSKRLMRPVG